MNIYLPFLIFVIGLIFIKPCRADMQSMLDNFKSHNSQIMDLKKKPENYGLAPRGFFEIRQAALHLEIAAISFNCNASNRKVCSNQIAKIDLKGAK